MHNIIYLDCEFSDLLFPELLSVALVAANGAEHYVELDPDDAVAQAAMSSATLFVQDQVLSQWNRVPGASCSRKEMGARTAAWMLAVSQRQGQAAQIAFDYHTDYQLLIDLLSESAQWDLLRGLIEPLNIKEEMTRFDASLGAGYALDHLEKRRGLGRHHALADAHALRAGYIAYSTGKRVTL